jgi:hypothetical protein
VIDGGVGKAGKNLGVVPQDVKVDVGQQADGVVPADGAEDCFDLRVAKGVHQILGPGLRVAVQVVLALQGVGHGHNLKAVVPLQPLTGQMVLVDELLLPQHSAGQGDDGNLVAGAQALGF